MRICIVCTSKYWGSYIANLFSSSADIHCIVSYTGSLFEYIKSVFSIIYSDIVLFVGGCVKKSTIINIALLFNKKVVFFWMGSDVITAKKVNKNLIYHRYIDNCAHICECNWIKEELSELGINADIINIAIVNKNEKNTYNNWDNMNIICYSGENREYFYGYNYIYKLAQVYPQYIFNVVGTSGKNVPKLSNIRFHGLVDNLEQKFANNFLFIRVPQHDGLSVSVLEALSHRNWVIYSYPLKYTYKCNNFEKIKNSFEKVIRHFQDRKRNDDAVKYVYYNYNRDITMNMIQKYFKAIYTYNDR